MSPVIDQTVPERLRDIVNGQLEPTEKLLWLERFEPRNVDPWWKWSPLAVLALLLGGLWTAAWSWGFVAAVLEKLIDESGYPVPTELGIPGTLVGLGTGIYLLGRGVWLFFWPRGPDKDPVYALTNRRVLVVKPDWFGRFKWKEAPLAGLEVEVTPRYQRVGGEIRLSHVKALRDSDDQDFMKLVGLRDVRATEAALRRMVQSSSKSSL